MKYVFYAKKVVVSYFIDCLSLLKRLLRLKIKTSRKLAIGIFIVQNLTLSMWKAPCFFQKFVNFGVYFTRFSSIIFSKINLARADRVKQFQTNFSRNNSHVMKY